jgi:hypothetical protein
MSFCAGTSSPCASALGAKAPTSLRQGVIIDAATAFVVVLAMAFGLIIPKLCIDRFRRAHA